MLQTYQETSAKTVCRVWAFTSNCRRWICAWFNIRRKGPTSNVKCKFKSSNYARKWGHDKQRDSKLQFKVFIHSINFIWLHFWFINRYFPVNKKCNDIVFFGILTSKKEIKILQNRKVKVSTTKKIGDRYHYDLSCKIEHESSDCFEIESRDNFKHSSPSIMLKYKYYVQFGVGTKLCNLYGQKGEIADVVDLSKYAGMKLDGTVIKPQVCYIIKYQLVIDTLC